MSYLSRVRLDTAHADAHQHLRQLASGPYSEHQMLWALWGERPTAQRDFLFRQVEAAGPTYFVQSDFPPLPHSGAWIAETKEFRPRIADGDSLAFDLRANPVVTRRGPNGKALRHDVIRDALLKHEPGAEPAHRPSVEREAGLNWLAAQGQRHGFEFDLDEVRTGAYRQERLRGGRKGEDIRYSTLDFTGRVSITDAAAFLAALRSGIGKAKAFGCGLLLIRRA
ncbi:MAG: type I-E CRISPR-associated protein Cas6/Cse3/CasE [Panacagrimonas sp.]